MHQDGIKISLRFNLRQQAKKSKHGSNQNRAVHRPTQEGVNAHMSLEHQTVKLNYYAYVEYPRNSFGKDPQSFVVVTSTIRYQQRPNRIRYPKNEVPEKDGIFTPKPTKKKAKN